MNHIKRSGCGPMTPGGPAFPTYTDATVDAWDPAKGEGQTWWHWRDFQHHHKSHYYSESVSEIKVQRIKVSLRRINGFTLRASRMTAPVWNVFQLYCANSLFGPFVNTRDLAANTVSHWTRLVPRAGRSRDESIFIFDPLSVCRVIPRLRTLVNMRF